MITATIGELLDGKLDDLDRRGHRLYLVRDGETVFYIGKSRNPIDRLWQHLGLALTGGVLWSEYFMSQLGHLVKANLPEARSWQVELLTLEECTPVVLERMPYLAGRWESWCQKLPDSAADDAEQALIELHGPCLNVMHNRRKTPLPTCYKSPWPRIANEGIKLERYQI